MADLFSGMTMAMVGTSREALKTCSAPRALRFWLSRTEHVRAGKDSDDDEHLNGVSRAANEDADHTRIFRPLKLSCELQTPQTGDPMVRDYLISRPRTEI
jgi:hypothetical protein